MPNEIAILRYTVREPFDTVVDALRAALKARGLRLAAEMDMSARIKRTLGIALPACNVLFVQPRDWRLSADSADGLRATCLPMHLVVAEKGGQTWVQVQDRVRGQSLPAASEEGAAAETQRHVIDAIETVAARVSVLA